MGFQHFLKIVAAILAYSIRMKDQGWCRPTAQIAIHSEERRDKEEAINTRFADRFQKELQKVADSLSKPRGTKKRDKVLERIGRLREKSHGIGQHCDIELQYDVTGNIVTGLTWKPYFPPVENRLTFFLKW